MLRINFKTEKNKKQMKNQKTQTKCIDTDKVFMFYGHKETKTVINSSMSEHKEFLLLL